MIISDDETRAAVSFQEQSGYGVSEFDYVIRKPQPGAFGKQIVELLVLERIFDSGELSDVNPMNKYFIALKTNTKGVSLRSCDAKICDSKRLTFLNVC